MSHYTITLFHVSTDGRTFLRTKSAPLGTEQRYILSPEQAASVNMYYLDRQPTVSEEEFARQLARESA